MTERRVYIDDVKRAVAAEFSVPQRIMESYAQERASTLPRQVAMALAYELTGHSSPAVARHFGDRHHSTILYARDRLAERRAGDRSLDRKVCRVKASLVGEWPPATPCDAQLAFLDGPLFDLVGAPA